MKEMRIRNTVGSMAPIVVILKHREVRINRKLQASLLSMIYGILCLVLSPSLGIFDSFYAFLAIILLIFFYLIFACVSFKQRKKVAVAIANICPFSLSNCMSITIDIQDTDNVINVRKLLLSGSSFNHLYLYFLGIAVIIPFFFFVNRSLFLKSFFLVFTFHICFLMYFGLTAFVSQIRKRRSSQPIRRSQTSEDNQLGKRELKELVINFESDCSICLSPLKEQQLATSYFCCNNTFHAECIKTWLNRHANCPLCRTNIV